MSNGLTQVPAAAPVRAPGQTAQRLSCLLEVAQVVNSSLEVDAVLGQVLSQAKHNLGAESGSIMLLEEGSRELRVLAAQGPRASTIRGRRQTLGDGIAGWVALHGQPVLLHGRAEDPRFHRICDRTDVRDALCVPLQAGEQVIGVISLNNRLHAEPFSDEDLELLTALAHQAALAIRNARSFQEMRRQRSTVERLLDELVGAQQEERMRIALQIHEGPAQTLFAALSNLEAARSLAAGASDELAEVFHELERTIRQAITETRAVMVDLRPASLHQMGLIPALNQYARQFEARTGIRTHVSSVGPERRLPTVVESCFYRIVQEALTNVWKHAGAAEARVTVEIRDVSCTLEIADDGGGFDLERAREEAGQHLGMSSLRDRAELVGGRFSVTSAPSEGTRVSVTVPFTD